MSSIARRYFELAEQGVTVTVPRLNPAPIGTVAAAAIVVVLSILVALAA